MAFDLSDYKTVAERIVELKEAHPDAILQSRVVDTGNPNYIAVEARCYRNPGDEIPGIGLAWEPVPGKTPYTKDSELQNAETSAWGRAIVAALVSDTSKGIASRDEVQSRVGGPQQPSQSVTHTTSPSAVPHRCPKCGGATYDNRLDNIRRVAEGKKAMPAFKCVRKDECGWLAWDEFTFDEKPIREDYDPLDDVEPGYDPDDPYRTF